MNDRSPSPTCLLSEWISLFPKGRASIPSENCTFQADPPAKLRNQDETETSSDSDVKCEGEEPASVPFCRRFQSNTVKTPMVAEKKCRCFSSGGN